MLVGSLWLLHPRGSLILTVPSQPCDSAVRLILSSENNVCIWMKSASFESASWSHHPLSPHDNSATYLQPPSARCPIMTKVIYVESMVIPDNSNDLKEERVMWLTWWDRVLVHGHAIQVVNKLTCQIRCNSSCPSRRCKIMGWRHAS